MSGTVIPSGTLQALFKSTFPIISDGTSGTQSGATSATRSHEQNLKYLTFLPHYQNFPNCIVHHVQIIYFNYNFSFSLSLPTAFHSRLRCVIPILWTFPEQTASRATVIVDVVPSSLTVIWPSTLGPLDSTSSVKLEWIRPCKIQRGGILSEIWAWIVFFYLDNIFHRFFFNCDAFFYYFVTNYEQLWYLNLKLYKEFLQTEN